LPTVSETLAERGARYGRFADHAAIAQGLQDVLRAAPNWNNLDLDMKQALSVMCDKFARILNGDPFYGDNWHDIGGYAKLIEDRVNMIDEGNREEDNKLYSTVVDVSKISEEKLEEVRKAFNTIRIPETPEFNRRWNPNIATGGTMLATTNYRVGE
jgi:hypothetical protein